jgi:hypothetical protein
MLNLLKDTVMKKIKYLGLLLVAAATLGLSSCVVREGHWVPGHYNYGPYGAHWVPGHYN